MNESSKSLGDLERDYLATLAQHDPADLAIAQQEVRRFTRWFGAERGLRELRPSDVERYAEDVLRTAAGASNKLQPVRNMLAWAKKQGHSDLNLSTHVRIRRASGKAGGKGPAVRLQSQVEMTAEGLTKLRDEHAQLLSMRPVIAEELKRAMADKDFRENAPLDAARDRQAQIEARIREVEALLRHAVVVDSEGTTERVQLGRTVILTDLTHEEDVTYVLVSPNEVDIRLGRISTASPTGKAMLDRTVGDEIDVVAPMGTVRYRIERIE